MIGQLAGHWQILPLADELVERPKPHYMKPSCRIVRGEVRLAGGDLAGALEESALALEAARSGIDSGLVQPSLAFRSHLLVLDGRREEAEPLVAELLAGLDGKFMHPDAGINLPTVLAAFGHTVQELDAKAMVVTPTLEAVRAYLAGAFADAVDLFHTVGIAPAEARARLRAAEGLLAAGCAEEAVAQAEAACGFWREVGASAYLAEAEALLARARAG